MRELAPHDRPREKLARLGPAALGDNELLAIVIGSGVRDSGALAVANEVLEAVGGIQGLAPRGASLMSRVTGIGTVRAARILAAVELGRRSLLPGARIRVQIGCPRDAALLLLPLYGGRPVEQFGVVLLDTRHRVLRTLVLSVGTLDATAAHPREVFREATAGAAAAIVVFHNHPSGDPHPSDDDAALTARLVQAGDVMGIRVLDHVILGDTQYFSFREAGRL